MAAAVLTDHYFGLIGSQKPTDDAAGTSMVGGEPGANLTGMKLMTQDDAAQHRYVHT